MGQYFIKAREYPAWVSVITEEYLCIPAHDNQSAELPGVLDMKVT